MDGSHSVNPSVTPTAFGGRYFRMFPVTEEESKPHPNEALHALATQMVIPAPQVEDHLEDSDLPAGYTYFAQFVAHDLTLDASTSHQRQLDPRCLVDYRTPRFDLDGLYGRGPQDQPYLYRNGRFVLGNPFLDSVACDLPRTAQRVALIGDPRNDQNAILSQLHGLFQRLHNRLVDITQSFEEAQRQLRLHYQYVVLHDLLPRLVGSDLVKEFMTVDGGRYRLNGLWFYAREASDPAVAIEFSAAAFRLGHSMVRPSYRLNRTLSLPTVSTDTFSSLVGFAKPMASSWGIDWDLFVEPPDPIDRPLPRDRLQMAYKIDPCLAEPLARLPDVINLAERNLVSGRTRRLPSGQAAARWLGFKPIPDDDIRIGDVCRTGGVPITSLSSSFEGNCPLWVYVLAEASAARSADAARSRARRASTPTEGPDVTSPGYPRQLGDVGGRIVIETFLALLAADRESILNVPFKPLFGNPRDGFNLGSLIAEALA